MGFLFQIYLCLDIKLFIYKFFESVKQNFSFFLKMDLVKFM